jgi:uncharacterized DUF497 family protein
MRFTWDARKAASNIWKHRVTFEEAASVFDDERALVQPDLVHADRLTILGMSSRASVLFGCMLSSRRTMSFTSSAPERRRSMSAKRTRASEPTAASLREMPEVRDWSKARRNPYARGRRVRILDADLARTFPDSTSVNEALRELLAVRAVVRVKRHRTAQASQ